jgi:polysaccharide deacetylase 2 family uncharacterized protein YibQ
MADSDFDKPLGIGRAPRPFRRYVSFRIVVLGGLAAIATGVFAFITLAGDPMGGEPYAVAKIIPEKPAEQPHSNPSTAAAQQLDPTATGSTLKRVTSAEEIEQQSGVKVMRQGSSAPGALIITVPPDLGIHLTPAPDPHLVEKTRFGSIPRIGNDGAKPLDIYARPVVSSPALKAGAPRIALLIGGMGLDATATENALNVLPGAITLGLAPYGRDIDRVAARAREHGHEIVLQLPMEPFDYPKSNPGPHTLLTTETAAENMEDLHWLMSRFSGYAGVANFLGAKFTADDNALKPILREIAARGLYYADDGTSAQSLAATLAPGINLAAAQADISFDASLKPGTLEAALIKLEARARDKGLAVGVASGLPSGDIDRIAHFAQALEAKGINLVPLSAVASKDAIGNDGAKPVVTREP